MIKKPTIVITSIGRTGTKFFYTLFKTIIPYGTSLHEPDVFNIVQYHGVDELIKQVINQIQESGVSNLIFRKILGQWSLSRLSDARVRGELDYKEAVRQVLRQRKNFVHSRKGSVYIESNAGCYGLIDVLKDVYERHRVVYVIRDGREWVQSWLNWGEMHGMYGGMYGRAGIGKVFGRNWPSASDIANDPYCHKWDSMSPFERVCWAWLKLNEYASGTIPKNPHVRVFRFEDIFKSKDRYQHLTELVQFVTTFSDMKLVMATDSLEGWLDQQSHKSITKFPNWEEWSSVHKQQFKTICGPLMDKLGYEC